MNRSENQSPTAADPNIQESNPCPRIAELIDYVLGRASPADCRRVASHLEAGSCSHCARWVEQAGDFRKEPFVDPMALQNFVRSSSRSGRSISVSDATPVPENAKWQRQAFRDLEERLQLLDEA
jgi:anti-sigma factor RsiW